MMTKKWARFLLLSILLLFPIAGTVQAEQWKNPELLVDADTVKANIDKPDWVVVDARDLKDYVKGHIPGAINLGDRAKKALRDPTSRAFNDPAKYEALLGKVGIGNDTHVVFYYDGLKNIHDATIGFWILEYLGHDKVYVLNGGLDAWRKGGNRLDTTPTIKPEKTFKANVVASRLATTGEILEISAGNGTQLIDSRTKNEYLGKDMRALQGGHVRGAINVDNVDTMVKANDPKTGKPKATDYISPESVGAHFKDLDPTKRTVAYCQTGTRSTLTYLELRLMGFDNPANWDESWRVYGSDLHAANLIEAPNGVQFYNFDKVNKSIKELDKKVAALEKTMKKLNGGK
ncbi:MAG: rhodanese-like domain-containing protein [Desulfobulbaceae bacterium]|nr:rhodanese-like domain-containing protein [Desulfobulbaceae bacterium]